MKIKWTVTDRPSGRYRSFQRRGWPSANFVNADESNCAWIGCEDDYEPADVRTGNHRPLKVYIADYSTRSNDGNCPYTRRKLKVEPRTLQAAKDLVKYFYEKNPQCLPQS